MNEKIDIFLTAYLRPKMTLETIKYLKERTKYPYRLFIIHQGGNEEALMQYADDFFLVIDPSYNIGIHAAWNLSLSLAASDYFITSDNDIYVPDLEPDWLTQMVKFMDERPDYGAISMHPHVLIGDASFDPKDPEDVKEVGHCGAVMRIMRRDAVWKAGGWEKWVRQGRNHEETTICSRLRAIGYKIGRTTRLRAYHPFGAGMEGSWGYPISFTPEMQGHRPELAEYVK
ncbi:MAG: glycosyltransferase, partial [Candidatus Curtissbacteria bacterium]|nr:glycosyltransferase [Candidatus Curtissbacteria bacterium]